MAEQDNKVKKQQQQNQPAGASEGLETAGTAVEHHAHVGDAPAPPKDFATLSLEIIRDVSSGVCDMSEARRKMETWKKALPPETRKEVAVQGRAFATRVRSIAEAIHQEWIGLTAFDV